MTYRSLAWSRWIRRRLCWGLGWRITIIRFWWCLSRGALDVFTDATRTPRFGWLKFSFHWVARFLRRRTIRHFRRRTIRRSRSCLCFLLLAFRSSLFLCSGLCISRFGISGFGISRLGISGLGISGLASGFGIRLASGLGIRLASGLSFGLSFGFASGFGFGLASRLILFLFFLVIGFYLVCSILI